MFILTKARGLRNAAIVALVAAGTMFGSAATAQDKPFYEGKTITVIVGFSPGGGSDLGARTIADLLGKHIEGNPEVVVQNMTGAGSVTAANYIFEKAPDDGSVVFFGAWFPISQAMGAAGMRVRYDELKLVAATRSPGSYITYMRNDAVEGGYTEPADILKAERLRVAGVSPTSSVDRRLALSMLALGVDYVAVTGHRGLARAAQSVRTGEMQASALATAGYENSVKPNMVDAGIVSPLFYWALHDDEKKPIDNPNIPDGIPSFDAFYEAAKGEPPSGKYFDTLVVVNAVSSVATHNFFGPPGMNSEAAAALRAGVIETLNDPEYIANARKISSYPHVFVEDDEANAVLDMVAAISPEMLEVIESISNPASVSGN